MRKANLKIKGKELDAAIRKAEGAKFNQTKISSIIMGKNKTYYCASIRDNTMAESVLDRVCEYYDLNKSDFILTPEAEKAEIVSQVKDINYENLVLLLTSIDRSLKEILAQTKSQQFTLNELHNKVITNTSTTKSILEAVQHQDKQHQIYDRTMSKLRSV